MSDEIRKLEKDKAKAKAKGNWKEVGEICNYMGEILSRQGDFEEALLVHEEEREVSIRRNDPLATAIAHRRLGECQLELGNYKNALSHLKEYLELAEAVGSQVEVQRAFATLGRAYYYRHLASEEPKGEVFLSKAENAFKKALELAGKLQSQITEREYAEMRGRLFLNLGLVCDQRGDLEGCARSLKQAIFLSKKYGLLEDLHRCQTSLANVYQKRKHFNLTLRLLDEAAICAKNSRNKTLICDTLLAKSHVLVMLKDFEGARTYLKKAYKLHSPLQEDHQKAIKNLKIILVLCRCESELLLTPASDLETQLKLYEKLGDGCASLNNFELALDYYQSMLKCAVMLKKTNDILAPIYVSLAETYADCNQYKEAIDYYYKEMGCRKENVREQSKTLIKIAEILELQGSDFIEVEAAYHKAFAMAGKCKDYKLQIHCLKLLLDFQKQKGLIEKAKKTDSEIQMLSEKYSCDNDDESSDEEVQMIASPFDDVSLSDLSACTDSETESEAKDVPTRPRRSRSIANRVNEVGETQLHRACIMGNLKLVKRLIERGHPVNPRDFCGWLPLHEACNHGFLEIAEYLLEKGALINDRGGEKCDGITPLHDAASCGHFEIIKLLLSKGASITARTNKGQTPLDCLREWRKRLGSNLDNETRLQCLRVEEEMEDALKRIGQNKTVTKSNIQPLVSKQCMDEVEDLLPGTSHDLVSLFEEKPDNDEYDIYMNSAIPDLQKDFFDPKLACQEYRSVMQGIRRRTLKDLDENSSRSTTKKPQFSALLDENNVVGADEWLEDDLNWNKKPSKRQCVELPNHNVSLTRTKKRSTHVPCQVDFPEPFDFENDDVGTEKTEDLNYLDDLLQDNFEIDMFPDENIKQNDSVVVENAISDVSVTDKSPVLDTITKRQDVVAPSKEDIHQPSYSSQSFCIKVKINDKLLLIPVGSGKTISWLAEEASNRYSDLTGTRHKLTLTTMDGAVLSFDDLVNTVLTNGERIVATIKEMCPLSLSEKYADECKTAGILPLGDVLSLLTDCDATSILAMPNMILPSSHMTPLCRAIRNHVTLTEFNFTGVPIGDEGLKILSTTLLFLQHLKLLRLRCCSLTSVGLEALRNAIDCSHSTSQLPLKFLEVFDISYNPLYDEASKYLGCLLGCLTSLKCFDVTACNFTSNLFRDTQLISNLKTLPDLRELYIGLNNFDAKCVNVLLQSLSHRCLIKLNLSAVLISRGMLGNVISKYTSGPLCTIQELCLSNCSLNDSDLISVSKSIHKCKSLKNLDISNNPEMTPTCIVEFLKEITVYSLILNISGCVMWTNELWLFLSKLIHYRFLKKIVLSCDITSNDFMNKLLSNWQMIWQAQGACQIRSRSLVDLIVNEC